MLNKPDAPNFLSQVQWNAIYLLSAAAALVGELTLAIQPLILDQVLGIAFEKEGAINADIMVVVEIIAVLVVGWFGLQSDRKGRVPIIVTGFVIIGCGGILSAASLVLGLTVGIGGLGLFYLTRILLSCGADAVQLHLMTLASDVSDYESRPQILANVIFMTVFGGTLLSAIILQITMAEQGLLLVVALPLLVALGGYSLSRRMLHDVMVPDVQQHPLRQVWSRVSHDPRMQLAFAAAFYSRADVIVIGLFYTLWCLSLSDSVDVSRPYAIAHAAVMIGIMGGAVLISIPVWKAYLERHSRITAIGAGLSMSAVGYFMLVLFHNPFNWGVAVPLVLVGVGHAGCLVALKVLTVDAAPKAILGSMLGAAYMIGGAGVIMLVQSSGYYFDAVGPRAPFALMGTGKLMILVYAGWMVYNGVDENAAHTLLSKPHKVNWKPLMLMTSALPFLWLLGRCMVGGYFSLNSLAEMPVGFVNRYLGDWAFTFLIISLSLRPLQEMTGMSGLAKYRRMVGLYAFFYATLHVIAYVSLEWALNWDDMVADIYKRPFTLLGLLAFLMLIPLAVTSSNEQIKKIGGKRWKNLHRLAYVINLCVAFHFIFAATHENAEPYVYGASVAVLLGYRVRQWHQRRQARLAAA